MEKRTVLDLKMEGLTPLRLSTTWIGARATRTRGPSGRGPQGGAEVHRRAHGLVVDSHAARRPRRLGGTAVAARSPGPRGAEKAKGADPETKTKRASLTPF